MTGAAAPDGPAGAIFQEFGLAAINDHGAIAFAGGMKPGVAGVTVDTAIGIWTHSAGNVEGVVVGDPPATGADGAFFETLASAPQFSNSGAVFADFQLAFGPGGVTLDNDLGGWRFANGQGELL